MFPDVSSVLPQLVPPERQSTSRTQSATVIVLLPIIITSSSHDSDTFVMYKTCRAKEKHFQKKPKPLLTNEANMKAATSCDTEPCEESETLCKHVLQSHP